jgi:threonine/homoserine/homoserine lactone efflux protein
MQNTITLSGGAGLFCVMAVLAAIPSVSVLVVVARSAAFGFMHGVLVALGIVAGDILYIVLAIFGLSMLVEAMGDWFVLVKYLGCVYLVWLGIVLWRSKPESVESGNDGRAGKRSISSSFLAGLLLTLGDQKAILFYLGFFPAFLDLSAVTWIDAGIVIAITIVAVGGIKIAYAWMANRVGSLFSAGLTQSMGRVAGVILMLAGVFAVLKA